MKPHIYVFQPWNTAVFCKYVLFIHRISITVRDITPGISQKIPDAEILIQKSFHIGRGILYPIFHPQRTVRITHEKRLPAKCRSTEICAAKDHTGSCRAAAVQSNKKQKGRFSSEHQDHSKAVRRH